MNERGPTIQSWSAFKDGLIATAKGGKAPASAGGLIVESAEALLRLLTPENRELLRIIRDEKPPSVAALARRTGRSEPNLARTLAKLEAMGLMEFRREARRRVPITRARPFRVDVDPFAQNDRISILAAGGGDTAPFAAVWENDEDSVYDDL